MQGVGGSLKRGPKGPSKYTDEFIDSEADALLEYAKTQPMPWLCHFATQREYPSENFSRWAKDNEKFCQALKRFKDYQEYKLVAAGLTLKNPAFVIFALKNVSGWRDRIESENDDETVGAGLVFSRVPENGDGKDRFKEYFN